MRFARTIVFGLAPMLAHCASGTAGDRSASPTAATAGAPPVTDDEARDARDTLPAGFVEAARRITDHASGKTRAWTRLAEMVDRFGPRLSGSKGLEDAIEWAMDTMARDGLENARRERVMVPHWVRGEESARMVEPVERELVILGLGGSVGTRKKPIAAELLVVHSMEELERKAELARDKIVLINQVMAPYDPETRTSGYGTAANARVRGPSAAARHGARAVLVRSVTSRSLRTPHTGTLIYADDAPRIPAAAVTIEDAELLVRSAERGPVKVELRMGARTFDDVESANVVAELPGRELPTEYVVIGGHIDSWDVGDGASDDGAGCIMAMEAARTLEELGLVPRRTIRVVLFTAEENGAHGAASYHETHREDRHVAAIESDSGAGAPRGFSVAGTDEQVAALRRYAPLFEGLGAGRVEKGWGGVDIAPLVEDGALGLAVRPDASHYFDVHHSPADTIDKIDPAHLQRNAAAMALMAYILAER
jgi:hypothetical protein